MVRSKNPDLIFEDVLCERAERVSQSYLEHSASFDLDRVTLFVTHKCNLKCMYCNGPHLDRAMDQKLRKEMLKADLTLEQYAGMLESWTGHRLKSAHFTGGEATLNKNLPEFMRMAKEKEISSTLTTNGMADGEIYRKLVENGLTEVRISIDSAINEEFDRIAGVKGACQKVKENIKYLAELRDKEGKDLFIILNACVGSFNIDKIKPTLDPLIALEPNDVKLLVVAEQGREVQSKASRKRVDELVAYVEGKAPDYELLKKKIRAIFRKHTFGLSEPAAQHIMKQCFIPLTERTLDARAIYPCSIYLRYKGKPLADAKASFEEQQNAILDFVNSHDCRKDGICLHNCTTCCKMYNIEVNKRLRAQKAVKNAVKVNIDGVAQEEIDRFQATYRLINKVRSQDMPFIIIKPYGLKHQHEILDQLKRNGIDVVDIAGIRNWSELSLFLYYKSGKDIEHRIARNKAYAEIEHPNTAIFLLIEKEVPEKKLARIKRELRDLLGEKVGVFTYKGEEHYFRSNCIHSPDYRDIERESKVIGFFIKS